MAVATGEVTERRGPLELRHLRAFAPLGADVVVTTRAGGVSRPPYDTCNLGDHVGDDADAVDENRSRLAAAMGVVPEALALARQVHGRGVAVVDADRRAGEADALVTTDAAVAIAVLVADCVPLVVFDPAARVLGVVHAGWRGAAGGVVGATLDAMSRLGASPMRCHVAMGPCISARAYQVGEDVAVALSRAGCGDAVAADGTGRFLADLAGACRTQLLAAGVLDERVAMPSAWTDGGATFFSDRATRPCGRVAMAARLARGGS